MITAARELRDGSWVAGNDTVQATGNDTEVSISFDGGDPLAVGLPLESDVSALGVSRSGSIAATGSRGSAALSVETLDDGVRIATVIGEVDQPTRYTYPLEHDVTPVINEDGTVDLLRSMEVIDSETDKTLIIDVLVSTVAAPWALDAEGAAVPTRYEVDGATLVQVVEHQTDGVAYPVVADPQFTKPNIFQVRIRWNRAETKTIATSGWGSTGLTAVCIAAGAAVGGPIGAAALGAVCFGISGAGVYTAGVAQNSKPKKCLQLTLTTPPLPGPAIPWFDTYNGGYCK